MTTFFQLGEVVFGKIKGYPPWPAKIIDISTNLIYTIKFYCDNSYAKLSSKFLLNYKENKNKIFEAYKKNKRLVNAIRAADSDLKKLDNFINTPDEPSYSNNDTTLPNLKINIDNKDIQSKIINSNDNIEPQNLEKNNNFQINKNLINISETMSGQNNRGNIFSITKNNKNIITIDNSISHTSEEPFPLETHNSQENKSMIMDSTNNNHIIIDKNILNLENDEELSSLLQSNKITENKNESEKSLKKIVDKKEEKIVKKELKPENCFLRIEIENLDTKNIKRKDVKKKPKVDDKAKEEKKKREEEDNFLYEIDEYFYKILELFNNKKFDKLDYEKQQFRRVLIYLANFKRKNFIEFLKMTNISKYIQYFVCYLKEYDKELNVLAKNVYKNFHKQFNKEYFGNMSYKV